MAAVEFTIVWNAFWLGHAIREMVPLPIASRRASLDGSLAATVASRWGGRYYLTIASSGYSFRPGKKTVAAFPPVFPHVIAAMAVLCKVNLSVAALAVTNASRLASIFLYAAYLKARSARLTNQELSSAIAAFCLYPPNLFHHAGYSEAFFALVTLAVFWAIAHEWPEAVVAALTGACVGTRIAGVTLLPVIVLCLSARMNAKRCSILRFGVFFLIGGWGLWFFIWELWRDTGHPLAFVQAQEAWSLRVGGSPLHKLAGLVTFEPLLANYVPSSECCWCRYSDSLAWYMSIRFFNPICFLAAGASVVLGWRAGWLTRHEIAFSASLLLFCYISRGYDTCMGSQARFASVVFPVPIVLGKLIAGTPTPLRCSMWALMAAYQFLFAALFSAGYLVI